jgi:hypothetical protein
MRIKRPPEEVTNSISWRLTDNARYWLGQLETFNTPDRSWAEEIGDFDEDTFDFFVADEVYVQSMDLVKRQRILQERKWYRNLRATQPTGEVKMYHMGENVDRLMLKIVLGQSFGLSIKELQQLYQVGESYISHGRGREAMRKQTAKQVRHLIKDWQGHYGA